MTGISMATLRAWERRYDFPDSERTSGGHRLYSERDVLRLRWVKSRIDEGMQTAQSIHALRHQEETGHLILTATSMKSDTPPPTDSTPAGIGESEEKHVFLDVFQDRLLNALVHRRLDEADQVLGEALAVSVPEDLILNVIGPAMARTGDLWEAGEINISTEHLATNYLRQRLLTWMLSGPPPKPGPPIVMACAPDEWHEGGLLIMGALLRRRRWPIAYLGQSLPLSDLAEFVRDLQPKLVVFVAMTEGTATTLSEWPVWMPNAAKDNTPIVAYAGRIFARQPEWRLRIPGMYLGNSFQEGVSTIEQLLDSTN